MNLYKELSIKLLGVLGRAITLSEDIHCGEVEPIDRPGKIVGLRDDMITLQREFDEING